MPDPDRLIGSLLCKILDSPLHIAWGTIDWYRPYISLVSWLALLSTVFRMRMTTWPTRSIEVGCSYLTSAPTHAMSLSTAVTCIRSVTLKPVQPAQYATHYHYETRSPAAVAEGPREHAVSWIMVKCCTYVPRIALEKPETGEWPSRSFKVTDTGAIRQATYDFLLVFHWKYASILYRFRDRGLLTLICHKFRTSRDLDHANLGDSWSCNS